MGATQRTTLVLKILAIGRVILYFVVKVTRSLPYLLVNERTKD